MLVWSASPCAIPTSSTWSVLDVVICTSTAFLVLLWLWHRHWLTCMRVFCAVWVNSPALYSEDTHGTTNEGIAAGILLLPKSYEMFVGSVPGFKAHLYISCHATF